MLVFLIVAGYAIAYGTSNPAIMGHTIGELEGVQARVTGTCTAGNAMRVINAYGTVTCQAASGSPSLPTTCSNNQVIKWNTTSSSWACANDIDTDTKCNVAGSCTQVCIGSGTNACRTTWPRSSKTFSVCARAPDSIMNGDCICSGSTQVSKVWATPSTPCTASSDTGSCSATCWSGSIGSRGCGSCCVCRP